MMMRLFRIIWVCCVLLVLQGTALAQSEGREMVLVSSAASGLSPFSGNDLRRLFLGLTDSASSSVTPVGNRSDNFLHEVFLQKVVFMSSRSYERHLLTKVFLTGNQRLRVAESDSELLSMLRANPKAIAFMWGDDARKYSDIKIIQTIWRGAAD